MGRAVGIAPLVTPFGTSWVAATDRGVLAVAAGNEPMRIVREVSRLLPGARPVIDEPGLAWATTALAAWYVGATDRLDLPIDPGPASDFERGVWDAVRAIPYGETASYGEVALMAGVPRGARAVGRALARCPLAPIVPCHRVVHANGGIGGWGSDLAGKRRLLELEATRAGG